MQFSNVGGVSAPYQNIPIIQELVCLFYLRADVGGSEVIVRPKMASFTMNLSILS